MRIIVKVEIVVISDKDLSKNEQTNITEKVIEKLKNCDVPVPIKINLEEIYFAE